MKSRIHPIFPALWPGTTFVAFCLLAGGCGGGEVEETVREPEPPFRMLLVSDPFARAMRRNLSAIEKRLGREVELELVMYDDARRIALQNRGDRVSHYDLISFDVVWLGELIQRDVLRPLPETGLPPKDRFLPGAVEACGAGERVYGLPVQPHSEFLWARRDLLESAGLEFPRTTDDLLRVARALHDPENGRYGIAWNAQRGQPLGQTMAHVFAAYGQPLLNEAGRPDFDTDRGLEAARYVQALLEVSPPDILSMAWDQRTDRFARGAAAMTYGWNARTYLVEAHPASRVRGKVAYGPPPHAPGAEPSAPLGVWALGVPSNARNPDRALRALIDLLEADLQKRIALRGNGAPPLVGLVDDPELQETYPVLAVLADPQVQSRLRADVRPPVPQWERLCDILGTRFHDMLLGRLSAEEALRRAQRDAEALFPSSGGETR